MVNNRGQAGDLNRKGEGGVEDRPRELSVDDFKKIWFEEWGFSERGKPEDAASYLEGILRIISDNPIDPRNYIESIGGIDGQQEFIFHWLFSTKLIDSGHIRSAKLTGHGISVLNALEKGVYYSAFGFNAYDIEDRRNNSRSDSS